MTTMTQTIGRVAHTRHHSLITAALIALFWSVAAALVMLAHVKLAPLAGATATIAAIVAAAYCYTRLAAPNAGVTHALSVGIAWLALSLVTEIAIAARLGHGWFTLIGSPDRPLLRNVYLFVWIFAPALFARGEEIQR